uniref:Uncharacterized protein n=1 Tax=Auxenochlorella protothecoides TaxID=3075 RepID=A0A1D2A3R8_AUXPR
MITKSSVHMDQVRSVLQGLHSDKGSSAAAHKDKLAQTKLREREMRDAAKADAQAKRLAKDQERTSLRALAKEERLTHDTKRAAKDCREMARREDHAQTGHSCEHGIWRCKICFPHKTSK